MLLLAHNRLSAQPAQSAELYQLHAVHTLSVLHNALRPDLDALVPAAITDAAMLCCCKSLSSTWPLSHACIKVNLCEITIHLIYYWRSKF